MCNVFIFRTSLRQTKQSIVSVHKYAYVYVIYLFVVRLTTL